MLSFTQHSKPNAHNILEPNSQPLVIGNRQQQPPPLPQKKIVRAHGAASKYGVRSGSAKQSREKMPKPIQDKGQWIDGGKIQTFDRQIGKNELASQQRRLRAEAKKKKIQAVEELVRNQKGIRMKTMELQREQRGEIQRLKGMIEKEKAQKERSQEQYRLKLKAMQEERKQLEQLGRKIEEEGIRKQKQYKKQAQILLKNEYPEADKPRCKQEIRTGSKQMELTQSQVNHELRQKQLELLMQQRERAMRNQHNIDYNPTVIPLLSRASYKIISTHISTLVQLFLDDLLEQQVYMLEQIQLKQQKVKAEEKDRQLLRDYYENLNDFVQEAERIENRVGRYTALKFDDLYHPRHYPTQSQNPNKIKYFEERGCLLEGLHSDIAEGIQQRRDRFLRYVKNFDQYKKEYLAMFDRIKEEIIDQAISKLAGELDRGSSDFVELIFRKEFQ